ncbi:MAG: PQQ-binding-like beta-propeller repeat protein, partial [Thermoplasmata archaeon]
TGNLNWGDGTPTIAEGKVFIGGSNRKVYCIDLETGTVLWTFQTSPSGGANYGLYAAPAVWNGYVYVAACDGWVYQIAIDQPGPIAAEENKFNTGYAMYGSPVIFEGKVYVGNGYYSFTSPTNHFFSLSATDLSLVWEFYPGAPTSFFSSAAIAYDKVFIGSLDGNLYALDPQGGSVIWQYPIGATWSSPAIASGKLFIGSKSGYLYSFDVMDTPQYDWRYLTGGPVDSSPAVSDGKVYVGTHGGGGRIYCFGSPGDIIPPFAISWSPTASNVPIDTDFVVTWSESMDWTSVEDSFSYTDGSTTWFASDGIFTHQPGTNTSIFNPSMDLDFSTTYWVTFNTIATDIFGNPLDQDQDGIGGEVNKDELIFLFTTMNQPGQPEITSAVLEDSGLNDVRITWNRSSDDGLGDDDVVLYYIYDSSQYGGPYSLLDTVVATNSAQYSWSCIGCGHGDSNNYFYYVTASDGIVESVPSNKAAKFVRHLLAGKNLISIPLVQYDESPVTVLQTIDFNLAWRYEAYDYVDYWKTFAPFKGYSDLNRVDHRMALWIDITSEGDLTIAGLVPTETRVDLKAGWNLVGFPSFDSSFRVMDLKAQVGADRVEGFDSLVSPHFLEILGDSDTLQPGFGYWVRVESDTTWSIRNL